MPTGITPGRVQLSWIPEGGIRQTAYQVLMTCEGKAVWNSGVVETNRTICDADVDIPSKTEVEWSVMLQDETGLFGEPVSSSFETGPAREDFKAVWIEPELEKRSKYVTAADPLYPASYLKKTFRVSKMGKARLYITAHGVYDAWINGVHVDGFFMAPGSSQYDRRLQVQTYDIGDLLQEGENEIVVCIGEGWYRGCMGWPMKRNTFGTQLGLLCQIEVCGEIAVATEGSWLASQNGPLGINDMMQMESYDANVIIRDWHPVKVTDEPLDNLVGTGLPVTAHEQFPAKLIITPKGEKVLDFGQNFAGYVEFDIEAEGGEILRMQCNEILDENGNFQMTHNMNPEMPYVTQKLEYICRPGRNHHHQMKCYYGFQYVKVETDLPITGKEFTGVAVYSDMEQTGFFRCGVEAVNRLFQNCVWSMKSNFVDIPTDCPTREKSGFGGDLQVFSETALYLMDSIPVITKWLRELAATQFPNGCVKEIAPETGYYAEDGSAGWCDAFEIIPWRIMHFLDDDTLVRELYPGIAKWMQFCAARARDHWRPEHEDLPPEIRNYLVDSAWHWGEWKEPGTESADYYAEGTQTGHAEIATAYLAFGSRLAAEMAERVGEEEDAAFFEDVAEKAKKAYRYMYVKDGRIRSGRQCHYVRPVYMDLLTEEEKFQAVEDLAALIKKQGRIGTGLLTTQELCKVLCDYGRADTAYDLLLFDEWPSWLYEIRMDANTIWEDWRANRDHRPFGSLNHYMYATIAGWMITYAAGIRVEDGIIVIKPYPDPRIGFAEGIYKSPFGEIRSSWRYEGNHIRYEIVIPPNGQACIALPGQPLRGVGAGTYTFT